MKLKGGQNICGVTIGVLCLDSRFPKPPGHIKNPSSLPFPVLYETVTGATVAKLLNDPAPEFILPFLDAARRLEAEGVGAITGSCGFLALFQRELAEAVEIPVFASSLIQVPLVYNMLGRRGRVGVLTASRQSLTERHFEAVGAGNIPVAIQGMEDCTEFREVILTGSRNDMDLERIEHEILASAESLLADAPDTRALVLECTDMPPYAYRLQERFGLPVFDLTTLATMVHDVVLRQPYAGIMPR
ncbi:aspartate/glutamate racemase family protein [Hoeflea sp. TYP-13]|uniref:aspartate/glutamate racemase family protein n=1 Tax=Hoeflea sp. TYP-13 TaxID=3230023 RepID=UPI0034C64CB0